MIFLIFMNIKFHYSRVEIKVTETPGNSIEQQIQELKTVIFLKLWWRWRESNPRPAILPIWRLHA